MACQINPTTKVMNLASHLFRKDVRQFRVLLTVWFGLLVLDLAVNLGWVGQVVYSPDHGFDRSANTWTAALPTVIWILIGILVSLVVLADSPARREGFLATRPVPKRDLLFAKVLFIFGLIVAPWTLQELVHLAIRGMPVWVVAQGSLERLMFILPVAVGFAAYAALWPGYGRWVLVLAGTAIGGYLSLAVVALMCEFVFHSGVFFENTELAQVMMGVYAAVFALVILAFWHSRAHRSAKARWGALGLVGLICCLVTAFWPVDFFALQPENPSAARSLMASDRYEIPLRTFSLRKYKDTDHADVFRLNASFIPKMPTPSAGQVIEWVGDSADIAFDRGGALHGKGNRHAPIFNGNIWNRSYIMPDYLAWSSEFPDDILFYKNNFYGENNFGGVSLNQFNLPANPREMTASATMSVKFEARVLQWRKIADLPLKPNAASMDEFGSWKFIAERSLPNSPTELYLERSQIDLATAVNSRCSSFDDGALSRMAFMVYDPLRHVAMLPDQSNFNGVTRGTDTGLAQYYGTVTLAGYTPLTADQMDRDRLIIFEKSWLGTVPQTWQSPSFTLDEKLRVYSGMHEDNHEPMPDTEFNHRIAALKMPAPDAGRQEVGRYLFEFLRLIDARRAPLQPDDALTRELAALVPANLDLLLDGLPVMGAASKKTVINAIKSGATEAQKPAVIAALQNAPELADVLLARGWVDDAQAQIYQLMQSSNPLPSAALSAIAWFHDPKTYPRLLEEFEANPRISTDDVLSSLPGLEDQLKSVIVPAWQVQSLVTRQPSWAMFGDEFTLALRHGQTSALQRAYLYIENPELGLSENEFSMAAALWDGILMPDLNRNDRQNSEAVLAWMRRHRPDDFIFNPALRRFVLKPTSGLTASNP